MKRGKRQKHGGVNPHFLAPEAVNEESGNIIDQDNRKRAENGGKKTQGKFGGGDLGYQAEKKKIEAAVDPALIKESAQEQIYNRTMAVREAGRLIQGEAFRAQFIESQDDPDEKSDPEDYRQPLAGRFGLVR
jgi:hypothetical protein